MLNVPVSLATSKGTAHIFKSSIQARRMVLLPDCWLKGCLEAIS